MQSGILVALLGSVGVPLGLGLLDLWLEWRRRRRSKPGNQTARRRRIRVSLFSVSVDEERGAAPDTKKKPRTDKRAQGQE